MKKKDSLLRAEEGVRAEEQDIGREVERQIQNGQARRQHAINRVRFTIRQRFSKCGMLPGRNNLAQASTLISDTARLVMRLGTVLAGKAKQHPWALATGAAYLTLYGWLLVATDFLPYVTDNNESFSSLWHAANMYNFGVGQSYGLADESFSPHAA